MNICSADSSSCHHTNGNTDLPLLIFKEAPLVPSSALPMMSSCMLLASGNSPLQPFLKKEPCNNTDLAPSTHHTLSTKNLQEDLVVRRYSPEERIRCIEKYRSKRKSRNFQKKINYTIRKTLAASRKRVKGRFARSEDSSSANVQAKKQDTPIETPSLGNTDRIPRNTNALNVDGSNCSMPEWWPAMNEALDRENELSADIKRYLLFQEMLAWYLGISSANLYSFLLE